MVYNRPASTICLQPHQPHLHNDCVHARCCQLAHQRLQLLQLLVKHLHSIKQQLMLSMRIKAEEKQHAHMLPGDPYDSLLQLLQLLVKHLHSDTRLLLIHKS
jgi:hypothetical protein